MSIVLSVAVIAAMWSVSPYKTAKTEYQVKVAQVAQSGIYNTVMTSGKITEQMREDIYPASTARISRVFVEIGDAVKKGQLLLQIEAVDTDAVPDSSIDESLLSALEESISVFGAMDLSISEILKSLYTPSAAPSQEQFSGDIKSPIDGIVMDIPNKKRGAVISSAASCISVSNLKYLNVVTQVPEQYISGISEGMSVEITGEAFSGIKYGGHVTKVMPFAKQTSSLTQSGQSTVEVVISIEKPDERLRPGYTVSVKFFTDRRDNTLLLPYEAVYQDEQNRESVFIISEDGRARKKLVETGYELEDSLEIVKGVKEGDYVIVNPPKEIKSGTKVRTEK